MRNLGLCCLALLLCSCSGYYESQKAFYEAQTEASKAHSVSLSKMTPIAELTTPNGTIIKIGRQVIPTVHSIRQASGVGDTIIGVLKTSAVGIIAGGWSAMKIIQNSHGPVETGGGNYTANSGNSTEIKPVEIGEDGVHDQSVTTNTDSHSSTSPPTIVNPLVVNPVVVDKQVVNPVILSTTQE